MRGASRKEVFYEHGTWTADLSWVPAAPMSVVLPADGKKEVQVLEQRLPEVLMG